ncbi:hypothetical protein ABLN87_10930 [Ruegeria sp. SCPT10]|uniref:hypothetical protein n=1 Tax=Ruegeria sp. SCP10 TaxID=3141377 RepID=UPI00333AEF79
MPYFERKPYASMIDAVAPTAPVSDQTPISELARRVLDAESGQKLPLDGPFQCRTVCTPGSKGTIVLSVAAPADGETVELRFEPGDLTNEDGAVIPADRLRVDPPAVRLAPGEVGEVRVILTVHDLAEPGRYHGRVHSFGSETSAMVVIFEIVDG